MMRRSFILFIMLCVAQEVVAQQKGEDSDFYRLLGVQLNAGTIFAHTADVENTAGSVPFGFELEYSKRKLGAATWDICHCYPTTGFVLGYTNYDNPALGRGIHASYFLEHTFLPFSWWSPVLRGSAGFSYSSNPFHHESNPDNQSYSLPVNAFLQLQLGVNFHLGQTGVLSLKAGYNHISNGGIQEPNKGINWPHLAAGYFHFLNYQTPVAREKRRIENSDKRWIKRIELLGAYTTREFAGKESFLAYGAMITIARQVAKLHAISLAGEWHYHEEHQRRIEWNNDTGSAHRAALLIGHDFLFGKVVFSQQIGVYVFDNYRYHDPLYHRWTISYVLENGISLGTSLKAHRHVAEFLDVRIGFQW